MGRGKAWGDDEVVILAKAYARSTVNPIRGADQTSDSFWDSVITCFESFGGKDRSRNAVKSAWSTVPADINVWVGCFAKQETRKWMTQLDLLVPRMQNKIQQEANDLQREQLAFQAFMMTPDDLDTKEYVQLIKQRALSKMRAQVQSDTLEEDEIVYMNV